MLYLARGARKDEGMPRPLVGPRRHDFRGFPLPTLTLTLPPHALIGSCRSRRANFRRPLSTLAVVAAAVVPGGG